MPKDNEKDEFLNIEIFYNKQRENIPVQIPSGAREDPSSRGQARYTCSRRSQLRINLPATRGKNMRIETECFN